MVAQSVKEFPVSYGLEGLLPCSQESATCTYLVFYIWLNLKVLRI
jgi:hypothetical protein